MVVLAGAAGALASCGDDSGDTADVGGPGKEIFAENCASCHGTEGEGLFGPDLHGVAERYTLDEHIEIVSKGRGGRMPPFAESLGEERVRQVVEYERKAFLKE